MLSRIRAEQFKGQINSLYKIFGGGDSQVEQVLPEDGPCREQSPVNVNVHTRHDDRLAQREADHIQLRSSCPQQRWRRDAPSCRRDKGKGINKFVDRTGKIKGTAGDGHKFVQVEGVLWIMGDGAHTSRGCPWTGGSVCVCLHPCLYLHALITAPVMQKQQQYTGASSFTDDLFVPIATHMLPGWPPH